jgi:CO dehydrogenase nickel-insertion accessory protein CooC1
MSSENVIKLAKKIKNLYTEFQPKNIVIVNNSITIEFEDDEEGESSLNLKMVGDSLQVRVKTSTKLEELKRAVVEEIEPKTP